MNSVITKKELLHQAIWLLKFYCDDVSRGYSSKMDLYFSCMAITCFLHRMDIVGFSKMLLLQQICEKKLGIL